MTNRLLALSAFCLAAFAPASLSAQDFYLPPIVDNVGMGNIAIGAAAEAHVRQAQDRRARDNAEDGRRSLATPAAPAAAATSMDFTYSYDRSRTRQNLRNFVARTSDPAARANLEQMIAAQPNIIREVGEAIRPYGLDPHDTADAYALWWINSWLVANREGEDPDRGTIAMVKRQVRNAFAATPDFMQTSDADRQEYAEALLLQATLLGSAFDQWENNPAMLDQLAQAARQGAKANGLNLSLMTLTRNGFVPRPGADASDALPEEMRGDATSEHPQAEAQLSSNAEPDVETRLVGLGITLAAVAGLGIALGTRARRRNG